MKPQLPNREFYSCPIVDISSQDGDIGKLFKEFSGAVVVFDGKRSFMVSEIPGKAQKFTLPKSAKNKPLTLGKVEARKLYDEYREFYEATYIEKKKQTEEYGAKTYAAEETLKKIATERNIVVTVRRILDAMKTRT